MTLPVTESLLQRLGWDDGWEAAFAEHHAAGLTPARVAVQHRGAYDLATEEGEVRASAANRFVRDDDLPGVGDWVGLDPDSGLIEALLPRVSGTNAVYAERAVGGRKDAQMVRRDGGIVDDDIVVVAAADRDLRPGDFPPARHKFGRGKSLLGKAFGQ